MTLSIRLKLMGEELRDILSGIFGFLFKFVPVLITGIFLILAPSWFGWWTLGIYVIIGMIVYLWRLAGKRYEEQREISNDCLHDAYYKIIREWFELRDQDKKWREICILLTPKFEKFEVLLEHHKQMYGEDDIYYMWQGSIETFCQSQKEKEMNEE